MRLRNRVLTAASAGILALVTLGGATQVAQAASPAPLPMTVANSSGVDTPMYVSIVGHLLGADGVVGPQGYLDGAGAFHEFPVGGATPTPAPDVSIPGPADGHTRIIDVPFGFSGRMYYSFGEPVGFRLVIDANGRTGLVEPVPWDPAAPDSQVDVAFDFVEFSYTTWGLFLNATQVDGMTIPASVGVQESDGSVMRTGVATAPTSSIATALTRVPGFENSAQTDGGVLRVVSPAKLVDSGRMDADYLKPYVDNVWAAYANGATLTVRPWEDRPNETFTGRVANGTFVFRDASGSVVARIDKPTTADVWRCDGALSSPNNATVGPIARSLCADLNRGTLGSQPVSPAFDAETFYRNTAINQGLFNHYAALVHASMQDGNAYGFAYDDVAHQESLVHAGSPVSASVDVLPRATGGPGLTGDATGNGWDSSTPPPDPGPSPSPEPTPAPAPDDPTATSRTLIVDLATASPGYANLTLGAGTTPGLLAISIDGASPTQAAINGPGTTRIDFRAAAGRHTVTITSTGQLGGVHLDVPGSTTTPAPTPVPGPTPSDPPSSSTTLTINLVNASPGYANLTLGAGTSPGVVTVTVEGRSATIAVGGPTTTRVDFTATAGTHTVTVVSTGYLGSVHLDVPGSTTTPAPAPQPGPTPTPISGSTQHLTITLFAPSPGYAVITLPSGTTAGVVTVTVEGRSATIAVGGPTTTRVDFAAGVGTHDVTVTSTGQLGPGVTLNVG